MSLPPNDSPRLLRGDDISVTAVDPEPAFPDRYEGTWPCPACGERQPFAGARLIWVVNRRPPLLERCVVVCSACFAILCARASLIHRAERTEAPIAVLEDDDATMDTNLLA